MTFKEATEVVYSHNSQDSNDIKQALNTIEWFRNNVLELEDYETDELIKVMNYIKLNNLEDSHNE